MKKILVVSAMLCLVLESAVAVELKVGVVDFNECFFGSSQLETAQTTFKKKFDGRQKEITKAQDDWQKAIENFKKSSPTMKEDAKKSEQQKLLEQQKKLQEMQTKLQNDISTARNDVVKEVTKEVEKAASKVAEKNKLDIVYIKASLAYSKKELSITDAVKEELKKAAK